MFPSSTLVIPGRLPSPLTAVILNPVKYSPEATKPLNSNNPASEFAMVRLGYTKEPELVNTVIVMGLGP